MLCNSPTPQFGKLCRSKKLVARLSDTRATASTMEQATPARKKVSLVNLGCPKNTVDVSPPNSFIIPYMKLWTCEGGFTPLAVSVPH